MCSVKVRRLSLDQDRFTGSVDLSASPLLFKLANLKLRGADFILAYPRPLQTPAIQKKLNIDFLSPSLFLRGPALCVLCCVCVPAFNKSRFSLSFLCAVTGVSPDALENFPVFHFSI